MSIKSIEEAAGKEVRSYKSGHVFRCFKCNLWVRHLEDNEMCLHCCKSVGLKKDIKLYKPGMSLESE